MKFNLSEGLVSREEIDEWIGGREGVLVYDRDNDLTFRFLPFTVEIADEAMAVEFSLRFGDEVAETKKQEDEIVAKLLSYYSGYRSQLVTAPNLKANNAKQSDVYIPWGHTTRKLDVSLGSDKPASIVDYRYKWEWTVGFPRNTGWGSGTV